MSNVLSNPNVRRGVRALATAGALYMGATACSTPDTQPTPERRAAVPYTAPEVKATSSTLPHEVQKFKEGQANREAAEAYVKSPERNDRINKLVQDAGQRFIVACQTGEAGPCDVYNPASDQWRSQSAATNEGWAWLQHNPQYGGKDIQFMTTVWVNNDWTIDASKGVQSVRVSDPNGSFGFEAPRSLPGFSSTTILEETAWLTTSMPWDQEHVDSVSVMDAWSNTQLDLQIIDETAISLLENFREMHQLQ